MGRLYEATWGRVFAALYDRMLRPSEESGLGELRGRLLAAARGRTIDIGSGTGANLQHYPPAVEDLVLAEPDPHMAKRLRSKLAASGRPAEVAQAPAERLPFEDSSFDTAVFTLVLCTIPDPAGALVEAARVLKPGGTALFLEHVRADEPRLARRQDRLHGLWRLLAGGCHCNRETLATIEASPLELERVERGEVPKAPQLVRPLIYGAAKAAS